MDKKDPGNAVPRIEAESGADPKERDRSGEGKGGEKQTNIQCSIITVI